MIYVCRSLFPSIRVQKLLERLRTEVATDPTGNSYGSSLTALRREKIWRGPLAHSRKHLTFSKLSPGYGFVHYETEEAAKQARCKTCVRWADYG